MTKSCFSQWYKSTFEESGNVCIFLEDYMMYHKAKLFNDNNACGKVLRAKESGGAKAIGRKVTGFKQALWEEKRFEIVVNANLEKFSQNNKLCELLINADQRALVEASPVDNIWGIGLTQDNLAAENPMTWKDLNLLGVALMEVREQLIQSKNDSIWPQ